MKSVIAKKTITRSEINELSDILKHGGIGVLPTDTIYGILGFALNKKTVEKIYKLRKRSVKKPMIILISSLSDLKLFNINLTAQTKKILQKIWPNPVSAILNCNDPKFKYLHRGKNSIAFRIPNDLLLKKILKKSGPLVAPSANWEGKPPATTVSKAKKYFQDNVDFYIDGGQLINPPSALISISTAGKIKLLRSSFNFSSFKI